MTLTDHSLADRDDSPGAAPSRTERSPSRGPLDESQVREFRAQGFLVLRGWLRSDEMQQLAEEFRSGLDAAYPGAPFDGSRRHATALTSRATPLFASLLEDPRFAATAAQLYGDDVIGIAADGSRHVGDTIWHADTVGFDQYGMKFIFYFEPLDGSNGALRVLPGSHRQPLFDEFHRRAETQPRVDSVDATVCATVPGDVIAYDQRLWHASCHGAIRRAGSVFYFSNPKTPAELAAARAQDELMRIHVRELFRAGGRFGIPENPLFNPDWIANPSNSPLRARWIARLRELGFFDARPLPHERDLLPHR